MFGSVDESVRLPGRASSWLVVVTLEQFRRRSSGESLKLEHGFRGDCGHLLIDVARDDEMGATVSSRKRIILATFAALVHNGLLSPNHQHQTKPLHRHQKRPPRRLDLAVNGHNLSRTQRQRR
jgi:hypothetical protein